MNNTKIFPLLYTINRSRAVSHRATHIQSKWKIQPALRGKKELNRRLLSWSLCGSLSWLGASVLLLVSWTATMVHAGRQQRSLIETRIALSHPWRNSFSLFRSLESVALDHSAARTSLIPHLCVCIYLYREIISKDKTHKSCFELTAICQAASVAWMRGPFLKK